MEQIRYCKEGGKNFLVLPYLEEREEDFQLKMIEKNKLSNLLTCKVHHINGTTYLYYDITSKVSLSNYFHRKVWTREHVQQLVVSMHRTQSELEDYLLYGECLVFSPEVIFYDYDKGDYCFLFYPSKDCKTGLYEELMEYLLEYLDHQDEALANIMYELFEEAENNALSIERFKKQIERLEGEDQTGLGKEKTEICAWETEPNHVQETATMQGQGTEPMQVQGTVSQQVQVTSASAGKAQDHQADKKAASKTRRFYLWMFVGSLLGEIGAIAVLLLLPCKQVEQQLLFAVMVTLIMFMLYSLYGIFQEKTKDKRKGEYDTALANYRDQDYVAKPQPVWQPVKMEDFVYGNPTKEETVSQDETVFFAPEEQYENKLFAMNRKNKVHIPLQNLPCTVGKARGMVDYCVEDASVSRMHARLDMKNKQFLLTDLNSTNGTFINGIQLDPNEQVQIEPGDEIRFGKIKYCFR